MKESRNPGLGGSATYPTLSRSRGSKPANVKRKTGGGWEALEASLEEQEGSSLERKFDTYWGIWGRPSGMSDPEKQYPFERYKLDRAWPGLKVSVELNGGTGGGHGHPVKCHNCGSTVRARKKDGGLGKVLMVPYPSHSGPGAERDARKANQLQGAGWIALTFTSAQLDKNPEECIKTIVMELKKAQLRLSSQAGGKRLSPRFGEELSDREVEILVLICKGMTYPQIGEKLNLSERSVTNHTVNIRNKLGAATASEAVAKALAWGIVTPQMLDF